MPTTVTVWNEYETQQVQEWMNEQQVEQARKAQDIYPDGIHETLVDAFETAGFETRTALFGEPDHGLTPSVLEDTDVLVWWSHYLNDDVEDEVVDRVVERIYDGMGLLALHSARRSKLFMRLMGTSCGVRGYRDRDETERVWIVEPGHTIADGLTEQYIEVPQSQIVAEPFEIPTPDEVVMISWLEGGEVFRSGCCFKRGRGKVFFFGPGHETQPVYHQEPVQRVLCNAVEWAEPVDGPTSPPLSPTDSLPPME